MSDVILDYTRVPQNPIDARSWIKEAVRTGCYVPSVHLGKRLAQRGLTMFDVLKVLKYPRNIEPYAEEPAHGGTCWRLYGRDVDNGQDLAVGVETYLNASGKAVIICTIFRA